MAFRSATSLTDKLKTAVPEWRPGIAVGRLDVWNWHARKRATHRSSGVARSVFRRARLKKAAGTLESRSLCQSRPAHPLLAGPAASSRPILPQPPLPGHEHLLYIVP